MRGVDWLLQMMYEHAVGDRNGQLIWTYYNQALGGVVVLQWSHDIDGEKWEYFGKMYDEIRTEWYRIRGEK